MSRATAFAALAALVPDELRELAQSRELGLRRPIAGVRHGRHRSRHVGRGHDFRDHRAYVPGDDPRRVDWRAAARRDALVLRQTEAERELALCALVDAGGGMGYGEGARAKWAVARAVVATLAWLVLRQGDRLGLALGLAGRVERGLLRPSGSAARAEAVADALSRCEPAGTCPWLDLLGAGSVEVPREALVVLVSDLWDPAPGTSDLLASAGRLRSLGRHVVVVQVVHRDELSFPWAQPRLYRFQDLAGVRDAIEGPGDELRARYLGRIAAHNAEIERDCEREGAHLWRVVTDEPLGASLPRFLGRLAGEPAVEQEGATR